MKITFSVPELQKQLGQLGAVVARKSQEALYGNVRLFTDATGIVTLQGIDIDATMTVKLPSAKAEGPVSILLVFSVLNGIVQSLKTKEAFISYKNEQEAVLTSGKLRVRLVGGMPTEKFLDLPIVNGIDEKPELGGYTFGLPGLKEQIEQVDFAVPAPDGKFVVPSALLVSTADTMSVVATDGVMLAIASTPSNLGEFSFTLPKPALELLKKLSGGTTVTISDTEGAFYFQTELELATYNKTHAEFPPYTRIIPENGSNPTSVVFPDKEELSSTIGSMLPVCDKDKPSINFAVVAGASGVGLTSVTEAKLATGDIFTEMADSSVAAAILGPSVNAKMDIKRLKNFLERATFPISVFLKSASNVIDIHANGGSPEKPTYRFLLMPMRQETAGPSSEPNRLPVAE